MKTKTTKTAPKFSAEEVAAMKDRAKELKAGADGDAEVMAKIAEMPAADRDLGERFVRLVKAKAPHLTTRLYYGMPAFAKDGKVLCWFKAAAKFKTRYATVGFSDVARLDDGAIWPTEYAVTELSGKEEQKLAALVVKAAG